MTRQQRAQLIRRDREAKPPRVPMELRIVQITACSFPEIFAKGMPPEPFRTACGAILDDVGL